MLRNFFRLAVRNITKHKSFTIINIAGLTLGLTTCLLIGLFVYDEKQFDKNVPNGESIYRIISERTTPEEISKTPRTAPMFATTLLQDYPEVEQAVRLMPLLSRNLFETGDKAFYEEGGFVADSTLFEVLQLPFKYGSRNKVLDEPNSIVITSAFAEKFFGSADPVGKELKIDKEPFVVKGVLDKLSKFHLPFTYILPMAAAEFPPERMERWTWSQFYTYIKLKPGASADALQAKFGTFAKERIKSLSTLAGNSTVPFFQPLHKIHLYSSDFKMDSAIRGNITYVRALSIVAIFILLIACFNFINLATAKSFQRAKEVGVRKSIGASRRQLVLQFTSETIFLSFISVLLSVFAVCILLPSFNNFTDKNINYSIFVTPAFILIAFGLSVVVGIIAGLYPAFVLSGFQPVKALKGVLIASEAPGKIPVLRHSLVVVQFALSALLIVSAIIVYRQVDYLHNKELGFNKEEIMFFPMRGEHMNQNYNAFKNELLQAPGVSSVSIGYGFPGDAVAGDNIMVPHNGESKNYSAVQLLVDHDYVKTLGLKIVAGRDFSKAMPTDETEGFIINETAVKELGFGTAEKAIGQALHWDVWESQQEDSLKKGKVVGVVKDFNYKSLYDKITVTVIQIYPPAYWKAAVKMKTSDVQNTLAAIKATWRKFSPDYPLDYIFLDENFEKMYKAEDKLKSLLSIFTAIAIFVGCLGLFGLAAYSAQIRVKEIGIRKVLGASVKGIVMLLSKDFIKLVVIALIIASPIAWYFMNDWLKDFAYRIDIDWWIFALAALISVVIALFTVSIQGIRSALANPIMSLRIE